MNEGPVGASRTRQSVNDRASDSSPNRGEAAGGHALAAETDISDRTVVDRLAAVALERFGTIKTLVNNAGVAIVGKLADVPEADARRLFDVNSGERCHGARAG